LSNSMLLPILQRVKTTIYMLMLWAPEKSISVMKHMTMIKGTFSQKRFRDYHIKLYLKTFSIFKTAHRIATIFKNRISWLARIRSMRAEF
jgi:hypothetical protein